MGFNDIVGHEVKIRLSNNTELTGKVIEYDGEEHKLNIEIYDKNRKIAGYKLIGIRQVKNIEILK